MKRTYAWSVVAATVVIGLALHLADVAAPIPSLVVLGGLVVLGEAYEIKPIDRRALPLSIAIFLVLARIATPAEFAVVVVSAEVVALALRRGRFGVRLGLLLARLATAAAAGIGFHLVADLLGTDTTWKLLGALAAASFGMLLVYEVMRTAVHRKFEIDWKNRGADFALITSGALMALGYGGVEGKGELGLWSIVLFAIPLVATWYSFERLASAQVTYWQTIEALGLAPELGDYVIPGHAARTADLSSAVARHLGMAANEIDELRAAAHLHHLGQVTFDPNEIESGQRDAVEVVGITSRILREAGHLVPVADIIAEVGTTYRLPSSQHMRVGALAGQILKVVSTYDELSVGEERGANAALASMYMAPGYVFNPQVLRSLEIVLYRRGEPVPKP